MSILDELDDETILWAALAAGGFLLFQQWRASTATPGGAAQFTPRAPIDITPPSGGPTGVTGELGQELAHQVPMVVSPDGIAFVKREEGFSANVTIDAGRRSIGYGHTIEPSDNIRAPITPQQGAELLDDDLDQAAMAINQAVTVPLTQNQFDALASLVFNIGAAAFQSSTLLQLLNAGNYAGAAQQFSVWRRSQGRVLPGLIGRRRREQSLFNSGSAGA